MTKLEFLISAVDFQESIMAQEWTFMVSTGAVYTTNPAIVETLGIDTTGSNFIVLMTGGFNVPIISVTDSVNGDTAYPSSTNAWTLASDVSTTAGRLRIYYCLNPQVGNNHTFKITQPISQGYYGILHVIAFDGATTAPFNYQTSDIRPFFGGSRYTTASIAGATPSINKSLFILSQLGGRSLGSVGLTQGSNIIGSEWGTSLYNMSGQNQVQWTWYQIQATASAVNINFNYGTWSSQILTALNNYIR